MLSWIFLCLWFVFASAFVILLAARNPYWIFTLSGVGFLVVWGMYAYTYPRMLLVSPTSMAFIMSGERILIADREQARVSETRGAYVVEITDGKAVRRLRMEKRSIGSIELKEYIDALVRN